MIGIPSQQYRKKPTMQQTELADLHFVDAKRIKELGNAAELPAYRTMVRCLDETSVEKNREQLEALLRAFGKERQHFIDLLFTRDHRAFCIGNRWRKLRDTLVMEKYRSSYGLQARHWKMALQTAAATVSNYWRLVQANALSRIRRKAWFARLNKLEQRYVYFLLGSLSEDFFTMLDGKCPSVVTDTEKESVASRKGLCKAMVRTIHDEQGKRPKHGRDASVWFDCSCYKALVVGEQVRLDLMSLTPGVRLTLYVKGCVPVSSTLKLVKHPDGTMALHVQKSMSKADIRPIDSPKASRGKLYCRALDLGFTEVVRLCSGKRFAHTDHHGGVCPVFALADGVFRLHFGIGLRHLLHQMFGTDEPPQQAQIDPQQVGKAFAGAAQIAFPRRLVYRAELQSLHREGNALCTAVQQ